MEISPDAASRTAADPAAPGWRVLAFTYDLLIVVVLLLVVSGVFLVLNGGRTVEHAPLLQWATTLVAWLVVGAYFVASWRLGGQTIGMRPWRLRVVRADGGAASARALWIRYAVACLTSVIGLLWAFVDRDRRALYDLAANTAFVRLRK